jgi:hypothetical protein
MKVGMRPVAEQYKAPLNGREIPRKPSQYRSSDAGLDRELKISHLKAPVHHTNNTNITTTRQCRVPQFGGNLLGHSQLWNYYCFMVSRYLKAVTHKMLYTMFVWSNALNWIQAIINWNHIFCQIEPCSILRTLFFFNRLPRRKVRYYFRLIRPKIKIVCGTSSYITIAKFHEKPSLFSGWNAQTSGRTPHIMLSFCSDKN